MIRMLKCAKDSAIKARTQAVNQMKSVVVTAPAELRELLGSLTLAALVSRCKSFRTGRLDDPTAAAKFTLRSLACRHRQLSKEIQDLQAELARLTRQASPALVSIFGIGPDTAAALLITAGSNPERLHSEAAFAALCGANPMPASSGKTNRHRLNGGGGPPGQCSPAPRRRCQAPLRPQDQGVHASTHWRGTEQDRGHPLPETLCRSGSLLRFTETCYRSPMRVYTSIATVFGVKRKELRMANSYLPRMHDA